MARTRLVLALLAGLVLAASLAFGFLPAVLRLYDERRALAGAIDPRLIDLASVGLNLILVVVLIRFSGLRRGSG